MQSSVPKFFKFKFQLEVRRTQAPDASESLDHHGGVPVGLRA